MKLMASILWAAALWPACVHSSPLQAFPTIGHIQPIDSSASHMGTQPPEAHNHARSNLRTYAAEALSVTNNHTTEILYPRKHPTAPRLLKRYPLIGDKVWNDNLAKGCKLLSQMSANDHDAGELFTKPMDSAASTLLEYPKTFLDWGYSLDKNGMLNWFDFEEGGSPIRPALKALKINDALTENSVIGWAHDRETTQNGKTYKVTGAKYYTVVNAEGGMILGWWKYSPANQARQQKPPLDADDLLPDLKRWSDVAYMIWADECKKKGKDVSSLRYIFSSPVENPEARGIIARAMDTTHEPPLWPGRKEYKMDTNEGKAILGSPNGRGAALLLIQHKATLGETTTIEKVAVFGEGADTNVLFYVKKGGPSPNRKRRKI